jgi:hypothetical protein
VEVIRVAAANAALRSNQNIGMQTNLSYFLVMLFATGARAGVGADPANAIALPRAPWQARTTSKQLSK